MKLAVALVVALTLALPAAEAKEARVVGLIWDGPNTRLAWLDPVTLEPRDGPQAKLGGHTGSWAFSPNRARFAIGHWRREEVRLVDTLEMRVLRDLKLPQTATSFGTGTVAWVRSDRLIATVPDSSGTVVVTVDPHTGRVVRRVRLARPVSRGVAFYSGLALLLGSNGRFAPAVVAVVNAEGTVRSVALPRISIGTVRRKNHVFEARSPGFAIDAKGARAFVVGADFTVAEVDLPTLRVRYHGGGARALAKSISGPSRTAQWLGNGLLAVSGSNARGTRPAQTVGFRLVDTRTWTTRVIDAEALDVRAAGYVVLASRSNGNAERYTAYTHDGDALYQLDVGPGHWLQVPPLTAAYAYVCKSNDLVRVVDLRNGETLRFVKAGAAPSCARPLYARSSGY